jgi:ADP-ribose pyrophosphatase YjhB (NUDIX family)
MAAPFTIGAFGIILDDTDRVLLSHRRDTDAWNLPGGGLESRETPIEAVVREVREETGLEVRVDRLVGVYTNARRDDMVFAFLCRVVGGELQLTEEADEHRYCALAEIPRNTTPKHVTRIRDALTGYDAPVFRRLDGPSTREWLAMLGEDEG